MRFLALQEKGDPGSHGDDLSRPEGSIPYIFVATISEIALISG
jgi:hypothetical protein